MDILEPLLRRMLRPTSPIAVLTGAGTAIYAGLPTMSDLAKHLTSAKDEYGSIMQRYLHDHRIGGNVERLLSCLESQADAVDAVVQPNRYPGPNALRDAANWIKKELHLQVCNANRSDLHERLFRVLWGPQRRLHLATLNYDRLIESGLDRLGDPDLKRKLCTGFRGIDRRVFDAEEYRRQHSVSVYHLHGAVGWRLVRGDSTDPSQWTIQEVPVEHSKPTDVLIYPTSSKESAVDSGPTKAVFEAFVDAIDHVDVLVTIGYSWQDAHVNELIRQAVDKRIGPKQQLAVLVLLETESPYVAGFRGRPSVTVVTGNCTWMGDQVYRQKTDLWKFECLVEHLEHLGAMPEPVSIRPIEGRPGIGKRPLKRPASSGAAGAPFARRERSYKMVVVLELLKLLQRGKTVSFDALATKFIQHYQTRRENGLVVECAEAEVTNPVLSHAKVLSVLRAPLKSLAKIGWIQLEGRTMRVPTDSPLRSSQQDAQSALTQYYDQLGGPPPLEPALRPSDEYSK